jgi:hypothetical protein
MAAGPWVIYNEFKENLGKKLIDLDADTFKCALFLSTSNAGSAALASAVLATLTNQHANANGYTTGGVTVNGTWVRSGATCTFDVDDASWTAAGGSIVARFAVIYDDTPGTKYLVAYCLLDSAPADVTVTDGNSLTVQIGNIFQLS